MRSTRVKFGEHVNRFANSRDAKEYLVSQIVEEAQRQGVSLSEIERKELYFSETGWTLPDIMEMNDEFDRQFDSDKYEKKVASLIRSARRRTRDESPEESAAWTDAIKALGKEDHYILVMLTQAGAPVGRPILDRLRLIATALAIVGIAFAVGIISARYDIDLTKYFPSKVEIGALMAAVLAGIAILSFLLRRALGNQKFNALTMKILEKIAGKEW